MHKWVAVNSLSMVVVLIMVEREAKSYEKNEAPFCGAFLSLKSQVAYCKMGT